VKKIKASEIMADVRSGVSDRDLAKKYRTTPDQLQYIFRRLVEAGLMSDLEFFDRTSLSDWDLIRAFSEESEALLNCRQCGKPLPENGLGCGFCRTISLNMRTG